MGKDVRSPKLKKLASRPRSSVNRVHRPSGAMVRPSLGLIVRNSIRSGKLGALILVLAGVWAVWYLFTSPRFVVRSFEIVGNRSLSQAEIIALSRAEGRSIWYVDPLVVSHQIAQNTYVMTAPSTLMMPDRLLVQVQERETAILWNNNGNSYEVASTGEILGSSRLTMTDVLVVYDTRTQPISPGITIDTDALELVQILNLRLPEEFGWQPQRYEWDPYYGISVFLNDRQVVLGRLSDERMPLQMKLAIVEQLVDDPDWVFLDVRSTKPYYRGVATPTPEP